MTFELKSWIESFRGVEHSNPLPATRDQKRFESKGPIVWGRIAPGAKAASG